MNRQLLPLVSLSALASAVNFFLPIFLTRILSVEEIGIFRTLFLYLQFLPALSLAAGVQNGTYLWAGRGDQGRRTLARGILFVLLSATAISTLLLVTAYPLGRTFNLPPAIPFLFAVAAFSAIASSLYEDTSIAVGRVMTGTLFYTGGEIVRTAVLISVAWVSQSLTQVLVAHCVVSVAKTILGAILAYRDGYLTRPGGLAPLREVLSFAGPVALATFLMNFVNSADQYLLTTLLPSAEFALYSVGRLSFPPILILEQSVMRLAIPQLSKALGERRFRDAANIYREAVAQLFTLIVPLAIALIVYADVLIPLLFGEKYRESASVLRVFALTYVFVCLPPDATARATGDSRWILLTFLLVAGVALTSGAVLTFQFGAMGALSALLLTECVRRGLALQHALEAGRWKLRDCLPFPTITRVAVLTLVISAVTIGLRPWFASDLLWGLSTSVTGGVAYGVLTVMWKNVADVAEPRVVLVVQNLGLGGLERLVTTLALQQKSRHTWQPFVFAYDHDPASPMPSLAATLERGGVPVLQFKKKGRFSLSAVLKLCSLVLRERARVVHTHDLGGLIYASVARILLLGRFRILHTQHSTIHLASHRRYRLYEAVFNRFATRITAVSREVQDSYPSFGISPSRVRLIENGVEFVTEPLFQREEILAARRQLLAKHSQDERVAQLEPYLECDWILYMARVYPRKGQEHAVSMWRHLEPLWRKRAVLLFLGIEGVAGAVDALMAQAQRGPDSERVLYIGSSTTPLEWLRCADMYTLLSEHEGMPLGSIEAVASGVPAVLSAIPGHEFLRPYCRLVPYDDGAALAAAVAETLATSRTADQRRAFFEQGAKIRQRYSVSRMVDEYEQELALTLGAPIPKREQSISTEPS